MARAPRSEVDYSEYNSDSDYSATTVDTLEDLMRRFTLDFQPDYTLKLRKLAGPVVLGTDLTHSTISKENVIAAVVKPTDGSKWWRRLKVDSHGMVTLRSRKLRWWVFTLDLEGHANPLTRSTTMSFRVATKWDMARGQIKNKKRIPLGDAAEARVHWAINYDLPEIEGSFGAASRQVSREVHADVGFAHAEVPKVELVLWPYSKRPQLTATSAGGGGHEEVAEAEQQPAASTSGSSSSSGGSTAAAASRDKGSSGAAAGLLPPYLTGDAAARPRRRARQADLTQLSSHVASLSLAAAAGGGRPGG